MSQFAKGLEGVIANETRLGDVRGQEGQLVYCGYEINELAGKVSFEEVIFLLWNDRLPKQTELDGLKRQLSEERELPAQVIDFIKTAPRTALPIDVLRTAISMLGLHDPGLLLDDTLGANQRRAVAIQAKVSVIVAYFHRARNGLELPKIRKDLGEAAHFLYLLDGAEPSSKKAETLDVEIGRASCRERVFNWV